MDGRRGHAEKGRMYPEKATMDVKGGKGNRGEKAIIETVPMKVDMKEARGGKGSDAAQQSKARMTHNPYAQADQARGARGGGGGYHSSEKVTMHEASSQPQRGGNDSKASRGSKGGYANHHDARADASEKIVTKGGKDQGKAVMQQQAPSPQQGQQPQDGKKKDKVVPKEAQKGAAGGGDSRKERDRGDRAADRKAAKDTAASAHATSPRQRPHESWLIDDSDDERDVKTATRPAPADASPAKAAANNGPVESAARPAAAREPTPAVSIQTFTQPANATDRGPYAGKLGLRADEAAVVSNRSFAEMRVRRNVCTALRKEGILNPLPLQDKIIPLGQRNYDVYAMASEGSGKTLAWAVLALQRMAEAGGWEERPQRVTPGVLALVTSSQKVGEAVKVLRRLGASGVVGLGGDPADETLGAGAAVGAVRYVVGTIDGVTAALKAREMSLARLLTFVVDGWGTARISELQLIVRAISEDLGRGREYQTVVFSPTMQTAMDKWLMPKIRIDRVVFQSMVHPLPPQVGVRFSFLRVQSNNEKHVILRDLTRVPAMDNIVVIAEATDIAGLAPFLGPSHGVTVWQDETSADQHEAALNAIMSDAQATVLITPECFEELDMDPEQSEVAMFVFYNPLHNLELYEARRNIYHRTCRSFVVTLISHESREVEAAEDFINAYDLPSITDCHPYQTSLPSIILGLGTAPGAMPPVQPAHAAAPTLHVQQQLLLQPQPYQQQSQPQPQPQPQPQQVDDRDRQYQGRDDRDQYGRDDRRGLMGRSHAQGTPDRGAPREDRDRDRFERPQAQPQHHSNDRFDRDRWGDRPGPGDRRGGGDRRGDMNRPRRTRPSSSMVERFIAENSLDHSSSDALCSLGVQQAEAIVRELEGRVSSARNPSALVMRRVVDERRAH